jgi:DNA polymerase-1
MRTLKGEHTGALYGFISRLESLIRELNPSAVVNTFDSKGKTFRHEMYPDYKGKRAEPPEDLLRQLPYIYLFVEYNL